MVEPCRALRRRRPEDTLGPRQLSRAMNYSIVAGGSGALFLTVCNNQPIFNVYMLNHLGVSPELLGSSSASCSSRPCFSSYRSSRTPSCPGASPLDGGPPHPPLRGIRGSRLGRPLRLGGGQGPGRPPRIGGDDRLLGGDEPDLLGLDVLDGRPHPRGDEGQLLPQALGGLPRRDGRLVLPRLRPPRPLPRRIAVLGLRPHLRRRRRRRRRRHPPPRGHPRAAARRAAALHPRRLRRPAARPQLPPLRARDRRSRMLALNLASPFQAPYVTVARRDRRAQRVARHHDGDLPAHLGRHRAAVGLRHGPLRPQARRAHGLPRRSHDPRLRIPDAGQLRLRPAPALPRRRFLRAGLLGRLQPADAHPRPARAARRLHRLVQYDHRRRLGPRRLRRRYPRDRPSRASGSDVGPDGIPRLPRGPARLPRPPGHRGPRAPQGQGGQRAGPSAYLVSQFATRPESSAASPRSAPSRATRAIPASPAPSGASTARTASSCSAR